MTSVRAEVITRRTYCRPKEDGTFETWDEVVQRVINHQRWLWERALGRDLKLQEIFELGELKDLLRERKVSMAGRTLWLGGTEIAKRRETSQFNCSFTKVETVHDLVDVFWLLMQGCGVGFSPIVGTLNGFSRYHQIKVIPSTRTEKGGCEHNRESYNPDSRTWTITIGDSAEAWSKAVGKLMAGKYPAETLCLDFSEIRPPGERLAGYGWISSGYEPLSKALSAIAQIMNRRAGQLLQRLDILDIVNWLGTVLSTRRSAEIALVEYGGPEWREFALAKDRFWEKNPQRSQSNNSLVFYSKPSKDELRTIFKLMQDAGGSEPGFLNGEAARIRAPWFSGVNPCAEILLANKSFCNLTEIDLAKFKDDAAGLERATWITSRANYRQTLVNLDDGILQRTWHENNEYLRLCGVGLTGIARRQDLSPYDYKRLRNLAVSGAYSMADELGTQRPKNITTIKPSGTLSKIMDTTEGVHKPLGRYIFNNVNFSRHDETVPLLREAGYHVFDNPQDSEGVLVRFPVSWDEVPFEEKEGKEVNLEGATAQLNRYKMLMENYCEQNCSITVSYSLEEVPGIVDWIYNNWDSYVGVSFIYRTDPSKTAKDLGYQYLPQEVVTKDQFHEYQKHLKPVFLGDTGEDLRDLQECAGGACPVR